MARAFITRTWEGRGRAAKERQALLGAVRSWVESRKEPFFLSTPRFQTFSLQICERINFSCFKLPSM